MPTKWGNLRRRFRPGGKNSSGFNFHTQSFQLNEVHFLINILKEKFDLNCTVQSDKNLYLIYIRSESMPKFKDLVKPHFHHSMLYKLA